MAAAASIALVNLAAAAGVARYRRTFHAGAGERLEKGDQMIEFVVLHVKRRHIGAGHTFTNDAANLGGGGSVHKIPLRQRRTATAAAGQSVTEGAIAAI